MLDLMGKCSSQRCVGNKLSQEHGKDDKGVIVNNNELTSHYDATFAEHGGELYEPLEGMNLAAHERRMALLDAIPLGDIANATIVDYGVGSWGFGCIFPKLKKCREAIGFDISEFALEKSRAISIAEGLAATTTYKMSLGYELNIVDSSVDIFFCGECIEHVEDTRAFLTEIHRVLKPGGLAIFTTPNASPWLYRQLDIRWCVGIEHVALMTFDEFKSSLEAFFEPVEYLGFNQSILPGLDAAMPAHLYEAWASTCLDNPRDATSLIGIVRKSASAARLLPQKVEMRSWQNVVANGAIKPVSLSGVSSGGSLCDGAEFHISVPRGMDRCHLIFWGHDWSGFAAVDDGFSVELVNLYSHAGGCIRHTLTGLSGGIITIRRTGQHDARSSAAEVILFRVVFAGDES